MKVLLTGYSGFLGRHIALALKKEGFFVRVLLHRFTVTRSAFRNEADDVVWGGLEDESSLRQAVEGMDAVVHCAWTWKPGSANGTSPNEAGAQFLLEESAKRGVKSFAFISSVAVYGMSGNAGVDITERTPLATGRELNFTYPREKIAVEELFHSRTQKKMKLGVFRPGPIFDDQRGPVKKIVRFTGINFAAGFGNGRNRMPYIHAYDVARAIVAWLKDPHNAVYNITPTHHLPAVKWHACWGRKSNLKLTSVFIRPVALYLLGKAVKLAGIILRRRSNMNPEYVMASATRDFIYNNNAVKQKLEWNDDSTQEYTSTSVPSQN